MRNGIAQQVLWEENYRRRSAVCVAMPAFSPRSNHRHPYPIWWRLMKQQLMWTKNIPFRRLSHNQLTLVHMWSSPLSFRLATDRKTLNATQQRRRALSGHKGKESSTFDFLFFRLRRRQSFISEEISIHSGRKQAHFDSYTSRFSLSMASTPDVKAYIAKIIHKNCTREGMVLLYWFSTLRCVLPYLIALQRIFLQWSFLWVWFWSEGGF